ncbi:faah-1 [Symbiodinium pilosum]|uniref:Faah-1 protein n=1 Tax=Symbiodinium pilosum TaxID=2952 RepID=A0A812WG57_SYMPI|nr:faah-1 [Symbiodinium pilosum]
MESILALDIEELAAAIRDRRFSAQSVLHAYRARAEAVHQACNAVAFWLPTAEQEARKADEHLQRTGAVLGPLHGIPFTVKDHVAVAGTPITLGMRTLQRHGLTTKNDDNLVVVLRALGAIPFAKSTMVQLGMSIGGGSPAHGDTLNPWDTRRTSGGSSCGEGALVGAGASPFGIGSDVGGSVRIPAAYCGIASLKPTVGRISEAWVAAI